MKFFNPYFFFFTFILFSWGHSANAQQEVKTVWGEEIKLGKKERYLDVVGADRNAFYTTKDLYGTSDVFLLEKYRLDSMSQVFSREITLPEIDGEVMSFEKLSFVNDQFYLFTSVYNKVSQTIGAYCIPMNKEGEWLDIPRELDRFESRRWNTGEFEIQWSNDSSLFMVYRKLPYQKKNNEAFNFRVYTRDFIPVWDNQLELPYGAGTFEITQYLLDHRGNVFLLSGSDPEKSTSDSNWKKARKKEYVVFSYHWQEKKLRQFDVNLRESWVMSVACHLTPKGDLCIGGFYSKDQYFSIAGSFFITMNGETREILSSGLKAFDKDLLQQFMSDRKAEQGNELPDFYFDHLLLREDGSALMVAEQYYVSERVASDPTTGRQVVSYYYNYLDILVLKVQSDGQIDWAARIPKDQSTTGDKGAYSSYALFDTYDKVYFVFNDHPDNLEIWKNNPGDDYKSFTNNKRSVATLVTLDGNGAQVREALFNQKDAETILRPGLYYQTASGACVIYGQDRKSYRFGRLEF